HRNKHHSPRRSVRKACRRSTASCRKSYRPASRRWTTTLHSVKPQTQESRHEEDEALSFVSVAGGEGDFTAGRDAQRSATFSRGDSGSISRSPRASRGG